MSTFPRENRPTFAPTCCKYGIWVLHPVLERWSCSECAVYGPERRKPFLDREGWRIRLTDEQFQYASEIGIRIDEANRARKYKTDVQGRKRTAEEMQSGQVVAAVTEYGFSLLTGKPWNGGVMDCFQVTDVGPWNVRAANHIPAFLKLQFPGPRGERPAHKRMDKPGVYVLAQKLSRDSIRGWKYIGWARGPECLSVAEWDPPMARSWGQPCWYVYPEDLQPMSTLPEGGA